MDEEIIFEPGARVKCLETTGPIVKGDIGIVVEHDHEPVIRWERELHGGGWGPDKQCWAVDQMRLILASHSAT